MPRDHLRQKVADAYLAVESAKKVLAGLMEIFEAKLINGPPSEIEHYRSGCRDAFETVLERKEELIAIQIMNDGLDPKTRKLL
ncbi:hypothetical protein [Bradyrhizobium sp. SZCCHNRI2010]|uniref:hypothetical protein n=1 Tax=Bradyrhizobium sp. SZCCHNRI2010 TaxID=3057283 RepID=UPI0028EDD9A4|nr:hypothetical protein [Bradyrhizobium sp. SZCCHNRI2010]